MNTPRPRKKLPTDEPQTTSESGEVDSGEIVDDPDEMAGDDYPADPQAAQRPAGKPRRSHGQAAREFFAGAARDAMRRAQQIRAEQAARAKARADGELPGHEPTQAERLADLRAQVYQAGEDYMKSLRDSDILAPGFDESARFQRLDGLHRVYARRMMLSVTNSFNDGVHFRAITKGVGMMAAMYCLSPMFRAHMNENTAQFKAHVQARIDERATKKLFLAGGDRDKLSAKWARRLDAHEHRARGHRELHTEESAGMTHVALAEQAFARMRDPGADLGQIQATYEAMVTALYRQAADDGLSSEDVATAARRVVGQRMEAEPELACVFTDLAHGAIRKSNPQPRQLYPSGPTVKVWNGDFEGLGGQPVGPDEMFRPRGPMDEAEHQARLTEIMSATFGMAMERGDLRGFNDEMSGYMLGWAGRRKGLDVERLPVRSQERIEMSQTMLASMAYDGLDEGQARQAYSGAFVGALERIESQYPQMGAAWNRQFGGDWRSVMRDAVVDPVRATRMWGTHQPTPPSSDTPPPPAGEPDYQPA